MAVPGHTMPNMGQTITCQVIKNHIPLSQTQTTGKENQWQPRKEKSSGGEPHPFGLYGHATANTIKLTHTNPHTQHTHIHITSVLPVLEQSLSSVRCQGHERLALLPALQLLRWIHLLHKTRQKKHLVFNHIFLYFSQLQG